jgi:hypothetical protein
MGAMPSYAAEASPPNIGKSQLTQVMLKARNPHWRPRRVSGFRTR